MKKITLSDIFFNWFTLVASISLLGIFALWIWFSNNDLNALLENQEENPQIPSDPPPGIVLEFAPAPTLVTLVRPEALNANTQSTIINSEAQPTPTSEVLRSISAPTPATVTQKNAPVIEQVVIGQPAPAPSGGGNSKSHSSSKSS
jgi:hypothetical protein